MKTFSQKELVDAIASVGIENGDIVYVQSQLYSLGKPDGVSQKKRDEYCEFFIDAVRQAVGPEGTMVFPSMSTHIGRGKEPFRPELTPSNYGTLPNYIATNPNFTRSRNPLISIAAQGPKADDICGAHSHNNFNYFSPFEGMVKRGGKNLYIGVPLVRAMQLIHYCEFVMGVPYYYNKILDKRPIVDGIMTPRLTTSGVRFMNGKHKIDISDACAAVEASGCLRKVPLGDEFVRAIPMSDIVRVVCENLEKDPFFLLDRTVVYQYGDAPVDGLQDVPPPEVVDPALAGRNNMKKHLLRAEAESPRLSTELMRLFDDSSDEQTAQWATHLESFSQAAWREFAALFNSVYENCETPERLEEVTRNCLLSFLDSTRHLAHNFLLSYYFAPFDAIRQCTLIDSPDADLFRPLAQRFSQDGHHLDSGVNRSLDASSDLGFSDILLERCGPSIGRDDLGGLFDQVRSSLCSGGVAAIILSAGILQMPVEKARPLERAFGAILEASELTFERMHLWDDNDRVTIIARYLPESPSNER